LASHGKWGRVGESQSPTRQALSSSGCRLYISKKGETDIAWAVNYLVTKVKAAKVKAAKVKAAKVKAAKVKGS
jgi:hypothetical protein